MSDNDESGGNGGGPPGPPPARIPPFPPPAEGDGSTAATPALGNEALVDLTGATAFSQPRINMAELVASLEGEAQRLRNRVRDLEKIEALVRGAAQTAKQEHNKIIAAKEAEIRELQAKVTEVQEFEEALRSTSHDLDEARAKNRKFEQELPKAHKALSETTAAVKRLTWHRRVLVAVVIILAFFLGKSCVGGDVTEDDCGPMIQRRVVLCEEDKVAAQRALAAAVPECHTSTVVVETRDGAQYTAKAVIGDPRRQLDAKERDDLCNSSDPGVVAVPKSKPPQTATRRRVSRPKPPPTATPAAREGELGRGTGEGFGDPKPTPSPSPSATPAPKLMVSQPRYTWFGDCKGRSDQQGCCYLGAMRQFARDKGVTDPGSVSTVDSLKAGLQSARVSWDQRTFPGTIRETANQCVDWADTEIGGD